MLAEKRASIAITQVLVLLGILAGVAIAVRMPSPVSDEWYYQDQIRMFHDGDWSLVPVITMIPGYHAAVGLITRLFGEYGDTTARMVNLAGSLPLLVLAWRLAERNYPDSGAMRAAQTFFLPLLYPFFFLIYTETWSITLLVGMMLATLGGRVALAVLAAVASMAIRQDFVIWAAFALLLLALEEATWSARLRRAIVVGWPLMGAGALFVAFFVANGFSVALGDKPMHARPHNLTNLYVCLLYAFVLFIPYHAWNAPKVIALLRKPWIAVAVACGFAVYWQTFSNSHPDNQAGIAAQRSSLLDVAARLASRGSLRANGMGSAFVRCIAPAREAIRVALRVRRSFRVPASAGRAAVLPAGLRALQPLAARDAGALGIGHVAGIRGGVSVSLPGHRVGRVLSLTDALERADRSDRIDES